MTIFTIALVAGLAVAVAYVLLAGREFRRLRAEVAAGTAPDPVDTYDRQGRYFGVKAAAGVVCSTLVLVGVSVTPAAWYLLPFLAIGSSIAVIVAFLVDRRR
jgi:hypothetical protein